MTECINFQLIFSGNFHLFNLIQYIIFILIIHLDMVKK